jgi:hypothetical protein
MFWLVPRSRGVWSESDHEIKSQGTEILAKTSGYMDRLSEAIKIALHLNGERFTLIKAWNPTARLLRLSDKQIRHYTREQKPKKGQKLVDKRWLHVSDKAMAGGVGWVIARLIPSSCEVLNQYDMVSHWRKYIYGILTTYGRSSHRPWWWRRSRCPKRSFLTQH